MISYVWPPFGHAPVQRVLRFCKYLPEFGWEPLVLTVANPPAQMRTGENGSGLAEHVRVFRALTVEPPTALKQRVREWLRRRQPSQPAAGTVPLHARVQVLDTHVGWVPFATVRGWPLVYQQQIDAMLVTAPPFSSLLIGRWLQALAGRPWVADFRDEWCGFLARGYEAGARNRLAERLERSIVHSAARVVSVSDGITDNFRRRYSALSEKFFTITNGFDPDDFPPERTAPRVADTPRLRFVFVGTIVRLTSPRYFLQCIAELVAAQPSLADRITIDFYGRIVPEEEMFLQDARLRGIVRFLGYLPHDKVPDTLADSDVLLLFLDDIPGADRVPTAKIFEYLAARRFILAIVPEGEAARYVRECGAGEVVSPRDAARLRQMLSGILENPQRVRQLPDYRVDRVQLFSRREQTRRLAMLFDEIVSVGIQKTQ